MECNPCSACGDGDTALKYHNHDNIENTVGKPEQLLLMIKDAHKRMATNRDRNYRAIQQKRVDRWLEELSKLYETGKWMPL